MSLSEKLLRLQEIELALEQAVTNPTGEESAMEQERDRIRATLSTAVLERYTRLRRIGQGKAVARVANDACTCCLAIQTTSELQRLRTSEDLQTCSNCDRILCY